MSSVAKALNWGKKGRELPEEEKDGRRETFLPLSIKLETSLLRK